MSKYRLDFREPSWDWDDETPCQYYASFTDAENGIRRALDVEGQRFTHFRIYEQNAPGDWVLVKAVDSEHPRNSN